MSTEREKWEQVGREIAWRFTERESHAVPLTEDIADAIEKAVEEDRQKLEAELAEARQLKKERDEALAYNAKYSEWLSQATKELVSAKELKHTGEDLLRHELKEAYDERDRLKSQLVEARVLLVNQGTEKQRLQKLLVEAMGLLQARQKEVQLLHEDDAKLYDGNGDFYQCTWCHMKLDSGDAPLSCDCLVNYIGKFDPAFKAVEAFLSKPEIKELQ